MYQLSLRHLTSSSPVNNDMYTGTVKTTTLAGLFISVVAICIVYLMQRVRGNFPRVRDIYYFIHIILMIVFIAAASIPHSLRKGYPDHHLLHLTRYPRICLARYKWNRGSRRHRHCVHLYLHRFLYFKRRRACFS